MVRLTKPSSILALLMMVAIAATSCGEKQSIASKSARAYQEAVAKGTPVVGEGHMHGEQTANETSTAAMDHTQMEHGPMQRMSNMPGMQHGSMAGMDHSKMQHGSMQGMSKMPGMQHGSMAGMDHSQMQHGSMQGIGNMPGMQHGGAAASVVIAAPSTSSDIARLSPSSTLREDALDEPSPVAVQESTKSGGASREQTIPPPPQPPAQRERP